MSPPPPPAPSYEAPVYESAPTIPSGPSQADYNAAISQVQEKDNAISQLQNQINQVNAECANLNAHITAKDNQINQLSGQIQSLQTTIEGFQGQITQLNNEKAQLQAHIPQLQNQLQQVQQENMNLQQQIGPLQAQINKLQEESAYKDKRIQELKEPKAVMPSSLAQGITSQSPTLGSTPSFGTSPTSSPTTAPTPSVSVGIGSGRRICPNCGATGFAIKEVEDKSRILSYIPKPQYAKKSVCTKCGFEF
jgi:septal ring factor EnvC (AmiA/AmiB activator)